jgi:predicted metal-dependent phosphoesterase TrpH
MHDYKDLIKQFTKDDFHSGLVNLHIHTTYSDGEADFLNVVEQAKEKGCKLIAITDHNTVNGHIENPNCGILTGVEFDVWYKYIFLHLLAYGIDVNHASLKPFLAKNIDETEKDILRIFSKRNIKDLINAIHESGGIAVLAHPCCCWALSLEQFVKDLIELGLDGIEVYYPYPRWRKYIKFSSPDSVEKIAEKYHLLKTGGSDLHSKIL